MILYEFRFKVSWRPVITASLALLNVTQPGVVQDPSAASLHGSKRRTLVKESSPCRTDGRVFFELCALRSSDCPCHRGRLAKRLVQASFPRRRYPNSHHECGALQGCASNFRLSDFFS